MIIRYKKDNEVFQVDGGLLSTNLEVEDVEIFEHDILIWRAVANDFESVVEYECRVVWSDYFNGWSLIRLEIPNDYEIPIGECGIPLNELFLK